MLVFDLTSAQSFTSTPCIPLISTSAACASTILTRSSRRTGVRSWMRNITEYAGKDILKVLVGNKCDLAEKRVRIHAVT